MSLYIHRTLIVPAALAAVARSTAELLGGEAGAGMFEVGLSPAGAAPATHYVSTGAIEAEFDALLTDADALHAATQGAVPIEQCRALVAQSDVSDEPPFNAFARLGLQLVQESA